MKFAAFIAMHIIVSAFPCLAFARTVPNWEISTLFEKSDLVLIVTHIRTFDWKEGESKAPFDSPDDSKMLTPIISVLTVHRVLKGEYSDNQFKLSHHRFDWERYGYKGLANGPNLIVLPKPERLVRKEYMLFLKKNQQGMLLPVTGMLDPLYSLKELVTPDMNYSIYGKGPKATDE